uniref:Bacterial DPM1-like enzyme n=1 Tax=uncultured bacterium CSL1 TaxID=1091565 RepID=G4WV90_9BACT|nr:bacterial DPM1-like enzyme [uncultured bacterium CSL1]
MDLFFGSVIPILENITREWEIVAVNDGSRDDTLARLKMWRGGEPRIKVIALSRNFGKEAALTAGLHHTIGLAVIPIDADLQDPPTLIPDMVRKWQEGYKVVIATRRTRRGDGFIKRHAASLFYRLLSRVTSVAIPQNTGDFRLMDAQVVDVIRLLPERTRFMKGLFAWVGFSTAQLFFDRPARSAGTAKYSISALLQLAKDGIFSFTTLPLRLTTYLGLLFSGMAFTYAVFLVFHFIVEGKDTPGYTSIMLAVLGIGGVQLIAIGILGEYLGRIYHESKNRPLFVVDEKLGCE